VLHIDPYLLGHPDITVLSFATIGHVGKIPPKNISATGTFRRMRSSSPTFVTGQEQPPPKSGCVRACTLVTRASPDCEKLPTELPTERKSRDLVSNLNFTEEAFSTPLSRSASSRRALAPSSHSQPLRTSPACLPPPALHKTHACDGLGYFMTLYCSSTEQPLAPAHDILHSATPVATPRITHL